MTIPASDVKLIDRAVLEVEVAGAWLVWQTIDRYEDCKWDGDLLIHMQPRTRVRIEPVCAGAALPPSPLIPMTPTPTRLPTAQSALPAVPASPTVPTPTRTPHRMPRNHVLARVLDWFAGRGNKAASFQEMAEALKMDRPRIWSCVSGATNKDFFIRRRVPNSPDQSAAVCMSVLGCIRYEELCTAGLCTPVQPPLTVGSSAEATQNGDTHVPG